MSGLCGCFRCCKETPVPLDSTIQVEGNCGTALKDLRRLDEREIVIQYSLHGARRSNFDFLTHDNGETYIATFRAMYRGEVMGCDSNPIPKAVYNDFRVIKRKKSKISYCILVDTGGHRIHQYFTQLTKRDLEMLGLTENDGITMD